MCENGVFIQTDLRFREVVILKKNHPYDRIVFQAFTMILQFGINMVVPIAMMTAAGIWLDRRLGTAFLTVILFGIGAVAGGQNCYRMAKRIYMTPDTDRKRVTQEQIETASADRAENGGKDEYTD